MLSAICTHLTNVSGPIKEISRKGREDARRGELSLIRFGGRSALESTLDATD